MKNSKSQVPSSRKAPSPNFQTCENMMAWADTTRTMDQALVLREKPLRTANERHPFDLEERTAVLGENIIKFSKKILRDPSNNRLISQLVGAATSVGANYCEANEAVSRKDFRNSISRCKKEVKEAGFFLRMVVASEPQLAEEARALYREA